MEPQGWAASGQPTPALADPMAPAQRLRAGVALQGGWSEAKVTAASCSLLQCIPSVNPHVGLRQAPVCPPGWPSSSCDAVPQPLLVQTPWHPGSQRQPWPPHSSPGGPAEPGSNRGRGGSWEFPREGPHTPCSPFLSTPPLPACPQPTHRLQGPAPPAHLLHYCLLEDFLRTGFFNLSDYILKGSLTAPLEMENKHRRWQIEGIRANRMKAECAMRSHTAGPVGGASPCPSAPAPLSPGRGFLPGHTAEDRALPPSPTHQESAPT